MKGQIVIGSGIAAAVVLISAIATVVPPWISHKRNLNSQLIGFWQELKSNGGTQTVLEFTRDGTILVWEGVAHTSPPTNTSQFLIKNDTLVIGGEESWAPRIRIEDGLLAIETNSTIWFKRRD